MYRKLGLLYKIRAAIFEICSWIYSYWLGIFILNAYIIFAEKMGSRLAENNVVVIKIHTTINVAFVFLLFNNLILNLPKYKYLDFDCWNQISELPGIFLHQM